MKATETSTRLSTCGMPCCDILPFEDQERLSTSGMPSFDETIFPAQ